MADSSVAPSNSSLRHISYFGIVIASMLIFWRSLNTLVRLSLDDERFSYLVVIPLISAALCWFGRKRIFADLQFAPRLGAPLMALGLVLYSIAGGWNAGLSISVLALLIVWTGGFVLCYGTKALKAATFPIGFGFLMLPLPEMVLDGIVVGLQWASAEMTFGLFKLAQVPVLRQGYTFSLPGIDIEIAEECSGIRSSMSLFVASIVVAHFFLLSNWRRACLAILTIPIVIFKNAVRIAAISWLGIYVDPQFFHSKLHHEFGGLTFSVLGLALMGLLLLALQRADLRSRKSAYATLALWLL